MDRAKVSLDKDYYNILGVSRDARDEQIRTSYRRMALKVHPDRKPTPEATQKFIELNEAYRYLSDPVKRASYDRLFTDLDKSRPFKEKTAPRPRRDSDVGRPAEFGADRDVHPRSQRAPSAPPSSSRAHGTETADQKPARPPRTPPPRPRYRHRRHSNPEESMTDVSVPRASSVPRPRNMKEPLMADSDTDVTHRAPLHQPLAPDLSARKTSAEWVFPLRLTLEELYHGCAQRFRVSRTLLSGETEDVFIDIQVQPGWRKGTRVTFPVGNQLPDGRFQDLVFVVRPLPHVTFVRTGPGGEHLTGTWGLTLRDALVAEGNTVKIKGIHGRDIEVQLPEGVIHPGTEIVVPGEGMPIRKGGQIVGKGDLIVRWVVVFPDDLSDQQKRDLENLLG